MSAVYALYPDGHQAQRAVDRLRAAGLGDDDITVISGQPMEDFEFGEMHKSTYIWWIACAGGLIGFALSTWLAWVTETSWRLNTGGMPVVAWWPNLIVMFELTMLGAILATVVTLIVTAGLGRRRPALYDPEVSKGKILVGVEGARATAGGDDVQRALLLTPDVSIKTIA
jgi:hypothetical protein